MSLPECGICVSPILDFPPVRDFLLLDPIFMGTRQATSKRLFLLFGSERRLLNEQFFLKAMVGVSGKSCMVLVPSHMFLSDPQCVLYVSARKELLGGLACSCLVYYFILSVSEVYPST